MTVLLTIGCGCLIPTQVFAQVSLGIKGGYTRAWEEYGDVFVPENAVIHVNRVNVSLMAYYSLGKYLKVGVEPGWVERGAACVPGFGLFTSETNLMLNYFQAPVLISGTLPMLRGKLLLSGKWGYNVAWMSAAEVETINLNWPESTMRTPVDLANSTAYNRWDHGWQGGLSLGWALGTGELQMFADYFQGTPDAVRMMASQNRSIQIGLGYVQHFGPH